MNDPRLLFDHRAWMADANCRGLDPALFYPARGEPADVAAAKAVCAACTVAADCRAYAIETNQGLGIWGGLTRRELQDARRPR